MELPPIESQVRRDASADGERRTFGTVRWAVRGGDPAGAELTVDFATFEAHLGNEEHTHPNAEEMVYVLEGEFEHTLGDQATVLRPGDLIVVPRGAPHQIRNAGLEPARACIVFSSPDRQFVPTGR